VYGQLHLNSCSANAIAAALRYDELREGRSNVPSPSRLFIYYNERVLAGLVGKNSPVSLRDGYRTVARVGACPEAMWPYHVRRFRRTPTPSCFRAAREYRAMAYYRIRRSIAQLRAASAQAGIGLAAVVAAVGLMVAMAIMVASFRDSLDAWLHRMLPADVYLRAGAAGDSAFLDESMQHAVARLPGVGQRTAQRLAFHLMRVPPEEALALADAIRVVKERVGFCTECFNLTEEERCRFCTDPRRDRSLICVVESPSDIVPLERTHEYRGLYHVLGGALSPIDGVDPEDLRIAELLQRVEGGDVTEVLLATNPTMTGEATAAYLADRLRDRCRVTRLASGLPVGGDLEYADEVTLGRALAGRRDM
jgi:recombination protein RecR